MAQLKLHMPERIQERIARLLEDVPDDLRATPVKIMIKAAEIGLDHLEANLLNDQDHN